MAEQIYICRIYLFRQWTIKCTAKGQEIPEWIYEVVALITQNMNEKTRKTLPCDLEQNFSNFFVHILGSSTTSYIHSEISWHLYAQLKMSLFLFADTTPNVGDEKWELENIYFFLLFS